jgi:hypothetical protein
MGKSKSKKKPEGKIPSEAQRMLWNSQQGKKQDPSMTSLEMAIMRDNQGNRKTGGFPIPWVATEEEADDISDPEETGDAERSTAEGSMSDTNESGSSRVNETKKSAKSSSSDSSTTTSETSSKSNKSMKSQKSTMSNMTHLSGNSKASAVSNKSVTPSYISRTSSVSAVNLEARLAAPTASMAETTVDMDETTTATMAATTNVPVLVDTSAEEAASHAGRMDLSRRLRETLIEADAAEAATTMPVTPAEVEVISPEPPLTEATVEATASQAARMRLRQRLREQENQRRGGNFNSARTTPLPGRLFVPPTPIVTDASSNLKFYDFRIYLNQSDEPREHLFTRIGELLRELFRRDPTTKIHIYLAETRAADARSLDNDNWENRFQTEDTLTFLQKYFHKAIPYFRNGGWQTMRVLMSHNQPFSFLLTEMSEWMKHNGLAIFEKTLQVEHSMTVGWAYMSTDKTHKETLMKELSLWCGFPVGIQWRPTNDGGLSTEQIKAIHFEVEWGHASHDRRVLCEIYHWNRQGNWPLGMRFRFVPDMVHGTNTEARESINRLRRKQANIVKFMGHELTDTIIDVDRRHATIGNQSVRNFMMGLRTSTNPNTPLFTGINKHWDSPRFWVSFLPQFESEALSMLAGILPFLRFKYPNADVDVLDLMFSTEYAYTMEEASWDPKRNGIVSVYTLQVEQADKNEDDNDWLIGNIDFLADETTEPPNKKVSGRKRNLDLDNETVHTIDARTLSGIPQDGPTPAEAQRQPAAAIQQRDATPMERSHQVLQTARNNYAAGAVATSPTTTFVTPQNSRAGYQGNYATSRNREHYETGHSNQPTRVLPPPSTI